MTQTKAAEHTAFNCIQCGADECALPKQALNKASKQDRILAATPELLEALEATLPFVIRFSQHVADEFGVVPAELIKAIEHSEAAIRKAKG